jgi:hypothetical protein
MEIKDGTRNGDAASSSRQRETGASKRSDDELRVHSLQASPRSCCPCGFGGGGFLPVQSLELIRLDDPGGHETGSQLVPRTRDTKRGRS